MGSWQCKARVVLGRSSAGRGDAVSVREELLLKDSGFQVHNGGVELVFMQAIHVFNVGGQYLVSTIDANVACHCLSPLPEDKSALTAGKLPASVNYLIRSHLVVKRLLPTFSEVCISSAAH